MSIYSPGVPSLTTRTVREPPGTIAEGQQIGNEFASVEALWSQFENVMDRGIDDGVKQEGGSGGVDGKEERESDGQKHTS
jgi:hypothetical protein